MIEEEVATVCGEEMVRGVRASQEMA